MSKDNLPNGSANVRIHQTTGERPIERFQRVSLRPLPELLPDCRETLTVLVHKDFAVRFDANAYSTPPWTVGKKVVLKASPAAPAKRGDCLLRSLSAKDIPKSLSTSAVSGKGEIRAPTMLTKLFISAPPPKKKIFSISHAP